MSPSALASSVDLLLERCIGQKVKIPHMFDLCPAWPLQLNVLDEEVEVHVEAWRKDLVRWLKDPRDYKRVRDTNSTLFARGGVPHADLPFVVTAAEFAAWIYFWDDALDLGDFDQKPHEAEVLRRETIEAFRLGIFEADDLATGLYKVAPTYKHAQSLYQIGADLCTTGKSVSLNRFIFTSMDEYLKAAILLQTTFDHGRILEIDDYLNIRLSSSGVIPVIGISIHAHQVAYPDWFFDNLLVKKMLELSNIIIWASNDILSARDELKFKRVDNMIPLLMYHKGLDAQEAVDETAMIVTRAYLQFLELEPQILEIGAEFGISHEVQCFIASCKSCCIGIFHW
ncbi:hypothetical protein NLG97_g1216 [Lecanicillium saksenae]|uniref:Uncharacterized protein n=1 Tax=Lecanicillium saksenae TaxID=468837 RepID=A0ACC1R8H0_9HYPO|nr:hypothetical protein NLG97_g1216 [Lecanicillium saksenae]